MHHTYTFITYSSVNQHLADYVDRGLKYHSVSFLQDIKKWLKYFLFHKYKHFYTVIKLLIAK